MNIFMAHPANSNKITVGLIAKIVAKVICKMVHDQVIFSAAYLAPVFISIKNFLALLFPSF